MQRICFSAWRLVMIILASWMMYGTCQEIVCDEDMDCFYAPGALCDSVHYPALIILSCTGATIADLEPCTCIADSLLCVLATCSESQNHRQLLANDKDIVRTYEKLIREYPINPFCVYIYGFSGMGDQALFELFYHPSYFQGVFSVCAHRGAMNYAEYDKLDSKQIFLLTRENDWNYDDNVHMHGVFQYYDLNDTLVTTPGDHTPASVQEIFSACQWLFNDGKE
jgi:hypothetical protein